MNEGQHISSAFDRDLEKVQAHILKMGGLVEEAILSSATALKDHDVELADTVIKGDRLVDDLQELIHDETARVIALRAPTAIDLRLVLSIYRIATNLERLGDYSKNIAKRSKVLSQMYKVEESGSAIMRMAREVRLMLKDALDAYIRRDIELAQEVRQRDENVDQMYNSLFREFVTYMLEDPKTISACMHLHFIAKNIERMGDHTTSIAEQVIYMVTGEKPDDERPKADQTSKDHTLSEL